jgi:hypothetical protein
VSTSDVARLGSAIMNPAMAVENKARFKFASIGHSHVAEALDRLSVRTVTFIAADGSFSRE